MRSVVMGAAMLSPAVLEGCSSAGPTTTTPTTDVLIPTPVPTVVSTSTATATVATSMPSAQPTAGPLASERPRGDGTPNVHPTRGFAGAARAR